MASASWAGSIAAFAAAADWYVATTVSAVGNWDEPGLGEWTVGDLVGHTSRALLTVETYLDEPVDAVEVMSTADYYRLIPASVGDPVAVAQRGRAAAVALGADLSTAVRAIAERVVARVHAASEDDLVATPIGGMYLSDYLPTRILELTVHTCDLASALHLTPSVPPVAAMHTLTMVAELAARGNLAAPLLLAATGRGPLPSGFTVLGGL